MQSDRSDPHTSLQNRHTILPDCQIRTSSRTSDRHCFQAAPLQPTQSADYQTNQQTGCHRNNTASHGERIGDLRNCSIHAKLPVPVKLQCIGFCITASLQCPSYVAISIVISLPCKFQLVQILWTAASCLSDTVCKVCTPTSIE